MVSNHVSKSTSNMVRKRKRYQSILDALTMLVRDSPNMVGKRTIIILTNSYNQRNNTNLTMLEKNHLTWLEKELTKLHKNKPY